MHPHPRLRATLIAALLACAPSLALAQGQATKIFLVDSSEGYGVDGCLSAGGACGEAVANAWCRVHDYQRAISFGRATNDAVVSPVADQASAACTGPACAETVAITCSQ